MTTGLSFLDPNWRTTNSIQNVMQDPSWNHSGDDTMLDFYECQDNRINNG